MPGDYPSWAYPAAWMTAIVMASLVFAATAWRRGDLRLGFMVSLVWLKIAALILWLAGLDRPVAAVIYVVDGRPAAQLTVTANMLIALILAATNATAYLWPELKRELGLRRAGPIPGT